MAVYDDSVDPRIRALYPQYSTKEIGRIIGCSRDMVTVHLRRMGIEVLPRGGGSHRRPRIPVEELERTRVLWEQLGSYELVARALGNVTRGAVRERVVRYGFLRPDQRPPVGQRRGRWEEERLDPQPLLDELKGRWRHGTSSWDDRNLERMWAHAQKPTGTDIAVGTGFSESLVLDTLRGERRVYPHEAEAMLRFFGLEHKLFDVYPQLGADADAESVA